MDAVIAGLLLSTLTIGGSPVRQPGDHPVAPATTLTLRDAAARAEIEGSARAVRRQVTLAREPRFSKVERAIAIGAGSVIGFYAGAAVGWKLTDNPSNPDDDTSGLRGVVIGAPVGNVAGAILGLVLTR